MKLFQSFLWVSGLNFTRILFHMFEFWLIGEMFWKTYQIILKVMQVRMESECMETFPPSCVTLRSWIMTGLEFTSPETMFSGSFVTSMVACVLLYLWSLTLPGCTRLTVVRWSCIRPARSTQAYLLVPGRRCRNLYTCGICTDSVFHGKAPKKEKNVLVACNRQVSP